MWRDVTHPAYKGGRCAPRLRNVPTPCARTRVGTPRDLQTSFGRRQVQRPRRAGRASESSPTVGLVPRDSPCASCSSPKSCPTDRVAAAPRDQCEPCNCRWRPWCCRFCSSAQVRTCLLLLSQAVVSSHSPLSLASRCFWLRGLELPPLERPHLVPIRGDHLLDPLSEVPP